jgi:hypothetical protein
MKESYLFIIPSFKSFANSFYEHLFGFFMRVRFEAYNEGKFKGREEEKC